jgi:hypothetical protein
VQAEVASGVGHDRVEAGGDEEAFLHRDARRFGAAHFFIIYVIRLFENRRLPRAPGAHLLAQIAALARVEEVLDREQSEAPE